MNELMGKTPFFRLLLPITGGIVSCRVLPDSSFFLAGLFLAGVLLIFLSFSQGEKQPFTYRWLFGAGTFIFLFAITLIQCREQTTRAECSFPDAPRTYLGTVQELTEDKARSIQCPIRTAPPDEKKVMLYLEKNDQARMLLPGDEIIFLARLEPFRNLGNPGEWDYAGYMHKKGYAARGYLPADQWRRTGREKLSPYMLAQQTRFRILTFYRSLGLDGETYAFIAAITLGYKAYLSDDIKEAFRASGTAHVLAVSGLHTGVIYLILNLLLSFLGNRGTGFLIRQWLIILMLWAYAFVAGLSPSVIRAVIMLSLFCLGRLRRSKGFTTNTLAAAAFLILLFHPFSLYDASFLMSFGAVFSILWFQPHLASLVRPHHKLSAYVWDLMTVSVSAQLGLFPLVLSFFGTFPTWFFLSNLLVVPLMSCILYSLVPLLVTGWLQASLSFIPEWLPQGFQQIVHRLTTATLHIVQFMESLPFAQLTGMQVSLIQALLLLLCVFLFSHYLFTRRPRPLIIALTSLLCFQLSLLQGQLQTTPPQLVVFNSAPASDISLFVHHKKQSLAIPENGFLSLPGKRILRLSDGSFAQYTADTTFPIDILILSQDCCFDLDQLCRLFQPSMIVLDSSLPRHAASRLSAVSRQQGIAVHDVRQKGAFSLTF